MGHEDADHVNDHVKKSDRDSFCEITCAVSHAKHYNVVDMI